MRNDAILQHCTEYAQDDPRIDVLWLYGSRAKGTAQPDSDCDLAVAFNQFPRDAWQQRLQPEQLAMDWADKLAVADNTLSVVDINHIPVPLAYSIVTTGQVLLAKNRLRQIREENRISSMWELDYLYHRQRYG